MISHAFLLTIALVTINTLTALLLWANEEENKNNDKFNYFRRNKHLTYMRVSLAIKILLWAAVAVYCSLI